VVVVVVPGVPGAGADPGAASTGVVAGAGVAAEAAGDGVDCSIGASLENMSVSTCQVPSRLTQVTTDLPLSVADEPPDALPAGALARLGNVRFKLSAPPLSVRYSPDGKHLVVCH